MAVAINFPEATAPPFVGEGCLDLHVHRSVTPNGHPCSISCWNLSDEEIEEVIRTGKVWLFVYSQGTPPISVTGHRPFEVQVRDN